MSVVRAVRFGEIGLAVLAVGCFACVSIATPQCCDQSLLSSTAALGSQAMGPTPLTSRQVGPEHARMIADAGGSGVWRFFDVEQ